MARRVGSDGARTRAAICDAALRLIARYGYEAMSMRRLAEEIDLGAAALYRYFPNKQAMLFSLLETHMEDLLAAWDKARLPRSAPAPLRLEAFTRFHIRWHAPRAEAVFVSYMELRNLTPANFAGIERLRKSYEDELEAILRDGARSGLFAIEDTKIATLAIIAMLTGMTNWYREGGRLDVAAIEAIYWGLVRRAVGVEL